MIHLLNLLETNAEIIVLKLGESGLVDVFLVKTRGFTGCSIKMYNVRILILEKDAGMDTIRLKAKAKINLSLDVVGKMDNGYHDLRMITCTCLHIYCAVYTYDFTALI